MFRLTLLFNDVKVEYSHFNKITLNAFSFSYFELKRANTHHVLNFDACFVTKNMSEKDFVPTWLMKMRHQKFRVIK